MDLRQMRYFLAVVDAGSFSAAARALRVAQPALSQSLKRLEDEVGAALLHRLPRGTLPTEEGLLLAAEGRRLLAEWDGLGGLLRARRDDPAGDLAIGIPTSLGPVVSLAVARLVARRLPKVRLRLIEGLSGHIMGWLRDGTLDLGLVFNGETGGDLGVEPLASECLALIAPAASSLPTPIPLNAAAALPLILPGPPHGLRDEVERAFASRGLVAKVCLEIDALDPINTLVAEGFGYSILSPRVALQSTGAALVRVIPIIDPPITRRIGLAQARLRPPSIALRHALPLLRPLIGRLVRDGAGVGLE
ncbi:LysR family transcriptional regulator [Rhodospirillum rubrum]|uniref:Transcriptional regulator, LysR family n=1 Tax=Rhodospirillum rubrum (strain ATCC 11170 / ATH 1.1.1 / DSM 467 / LMG 4362 / NCIMB 8255 / S1) TaxID=269796 RepID=Q2RSU1_RHORT|nr:LysR family transcriptional regulator [Rhodospirillum rubrum]ABC22804.1 transcriptional regulator, LysR family [Rhodospirillum rubrum ATCC 11170]AEO48526.1 LysR family transcriptional regulator [Rhodospirillum rubrum F11]MBK5954402.1 LysR family transcriptional regulator [Rhodospirillum rubrum]QXG78794.1 LysR family transcriptional regulator [Rhodospirillum rubrum]HAP98704.1 LysR family transcriptional regulator [Rhodospirillum rubrum]